MKVYISHPIAGKTEEQKRMAESLGLFAAQRRFSPKPQLDIEVVLPRQIAPWCETIISTSDIGEGCLVPGKVLPGDNHSVQCYMRGDIHEMLECDAILVMPGWQASAGCRDEVNVAAMCGIPIHFYSAEML